MRIMANQYIRLLSVVVIGVLLTACSPSEPASESSENQPLTPDPYKIYDILAGCDGQSVDVPGLLFEFWTKEVVLLTPQGSANTGLAQNSWARSTDSFRPVETPLDAHSYLGKMKIASDGHIFVLQKNYLIIEQGLPPESLMQVALLELDPHLHAQGMFLDEATGQLVVLVAGSSFDHPVEQRPGRASRVVFVDIQDPSNPVVKGRWYLSGDISFARRQGDSIHLAYQAHLPTPETLGLGEGFLSLLAEYKSIKSNRDRLPDANSMLATLERQIYASIHQAVTGLGIANLLPRLRGELATGSFNQPLVQCANIIWPTSFAGRGLQVLLSFNINGSNVKGTGLRGRGVYSYSGTRSYYLMQTHRWSEMHYKNETVMHKFTFSSTGLAYAATGVVPGFLNYRLSFDEFAGDVRVASTSHLSSTDSTRVNNIFVFRDNGVGQLEIQGQLSGFALEQHLSSLQWIGDRAFIITRSAVEENLLSFDLANPVAPAFVSSLPVIGAEYIQPLGANHLVLVGGSVITLVDVSVPDQPQIISEHRIVHPDGGGYRADLLGDLSRFTFVAGRNLLVIPLSSRWNSYYSSEFGVFHADPVLGISEVGRIDQVDLAQQSLCMDATIPEQWYEIACGQNDDYRTNARPYRSAVLTSNGQDYLFIQSQAGVKVVNLDDPATVLGSEAFPWQAVIYY